MLAYDVIRTTAFGSAWMAGSKPREVSFVNYCQFELVAWDVIDSKRGVEHRSYCVSRLEQIGKCIVGQRPGRFEPRVLKKRASNYNLMMQPREELVRRLAAGDNAFETKQLRKMTWLIVGGTD